MKKCLICDVHVENVPIGTWGGIEIVTDNRMAPDMVLMAPTLCWDHRGGAISALRPE